MKTINSMLSFLALLFVLAIPTFAANFVVTAGGDAGDGVCDVTCTLRDAVLAANAVPTNDTITFAVGLTSVILSNQIAILNNGSLTITGSGANVLTIDGGAGTNRIFSIQNATVTITGVTLTGGNSAGAAIYSFPSNLTLDSIVVRDNGAGGPGGSVYLGFGGGSGTYSISNSTISGNQGSNCAGLRLDSGTLTVNNSTVSGNQATTSGGGICILNGALTMRNSTVTGNSATQGGGLYLQLGTVDLGNTIIAGNTGLNFPEISVQGGTFLSSGYNLIGDSAGDSTNTNNAIIYQLTDILDTPPMLAALSLAYVGTTPTHALLTGSPAIDQGFAFGSIRDQRGSLRPVDNPSIPNAAGGDGSDIGAYERALAPTSATVTAGGRITTQNGSGISNVRVTIMDAGGGSRTTISSPFGYFRFTNVPAGHSYIFSVLSKSYSFEPSSLARSIMADDDEINFVADEVGSIEGTRSSSDRSLKADRS